MNPDNPEKASSSLSTLVSVMNSNEQFFKVLAKVDQGSVEELISKGADINGLTNLGESVWAFVVPSGPDAVRLALGLGANPNSIDGQGNSSLYSAIYSDDPEIARILIEHGAKISSNLESDRFNLLHTAALAGKASVLAVLIAAAPPSLLREENIFGRTPFGEAVAAKQDDCIRLLRAIEPTCQL